MYLDSSPIVRWWLQEPSALSDRSRWTSVLFSALASVEVRRALLRLRSEGVLSPDQAAELLSRQVRLEQDATLIPISDAVLRRASESFGGPVKTLDAIHLATAVLLRELEPDLVFATHDRQQAFAARELGFEVVGYKFDE